MNDRSDPSHTATRTAPRWEHFPHGADIGVRGIGATLEAAFEQGARALTAVITDPDRVTADEWIELRCEAPDVETLFVDWLNALVYEMSCSRKLFGQFHVTIENGRLFGKAGGQPIDPQTHEPGVEIKGATYTCLRVGEENGYWVAECVVDV